MTVSGACPSALVTGGGTGIGRAIAQRLASDGFVVTVMGRRAGPLRDAAACIDGVQGISVGDVTNENDVQRAVDQASERGALKATVLAAGVGTAPAPLLDTSYSSWRSTMAINLDGAFLTMKCSASALGANGGGSIVAISSTAAARPHHSMGAYATSKAALDALVMNAANEFGSVNVRVNSVRAGVVPTEMTAPLFGNPRFIARYQAELPLHTLGSVEDIANAVSFLVDDRSAFITGDCILVDGGNALRSVIDSRFMAR